MCQASVIIVDENVYYPFSHISKTINFIHLFAFAMNKQRVGSALFERFFYLPMFARWIEYFYFFSILLTHEGSHREEVYRNFQPSLTSSAGCAKGWSDNRFRAIPAYTTQLLTLHQDRANNQYRTANQI